MEEVEARLTALYRRRTGKVVSRVLRVGDLFYDARQKRAKFADVDVKLSPKGMRLLETLMGDPGRVFSRRDLEIALWGDEQETSDRLRNHVHVLRRALIRAAGRDPIETVHGQGFRLPISG